MGVDAKCILKETMPTKIAEYLHSLPHVEKVKMAPAMNDFWWIIFYWHGEKRCMAIFFNGNCKSDYESVYPHDACYCSIGKWGMSDAIVISLAKHFGGFYQLEDTTDQWKSS